MLSKPPLFFFYVFSQEERYVYTKPCAQILIAILIEIDKSRNQQNCSSIGAQINYSILMQWNSTQQ